MRKPIATAMVFSAGLWLVSCAEPATDAEIAQMCEHLNEIGGEFDSPPAAERTAKVEADFGDQLKQLEEKRDAEVQAIEKEREAKLADAKKDEEKAAITAELDGKKTAKTAEFKAMIDKLGADKAEAIEKAEDLAKADVDAAKEAVDKCVAENKGVGLSKEVAKCRIGVATTDEYWNKCK